MTDYNQQHSGSEWAIHLTVFILSIAFAIFLTAQIRGTVQSGKTMQWQLSNIDKQIENVKAAEKQADELNQKSEEPVKQAQQLQERFSALLNDVYDLAKDDDDAKKVVQKWKIQRGPDAKDSKDAKSDK